MTPAPNAAFETPWVQIRTAGVHPLLYKRMVGETDPAAKPGDVVHIYDRSGRRIGAGLFNPRAPIVVRRLAGETEVIDESFWRRRLRDAIELRRFLAVDGVTDAYRLVHAEGDGLSGLIVERFADRLVFEVFSIGMFQRAAMIGGLLSELLGRPAALDRPDRAAEQWRVLIRADEPIERAEGFRAPPMDDDAGHTLVIREHGLRYRVDPAGGHKTGFFCDQRDNRRRLAGWCGGASVLDLCCYSGGFGLCAAKLGGAKQVTGVDLDEHAVALAKDNANLNQVRIEHVHADAFTYLRQMIANGRAYDVVVLDPPKLAFSRDGLEEALRRYHDLNGLALQVVRSGGLLLTCSCSGLVSEEAFIETVHRAARRFGRTLQLVDRSGAAPDHPVALECPESAYLKALWLRVQTGASVRRP